ncbi:MAG: 50S ribosomal protein L20 [Calditrichaeota bacterium]|nr:50S ribosomal protein L20 [Calditrichota bacterium]
MPRSQNKVASRARRKKVLKQAKGYRLAKSKLFKTAKESVDRALSYAYRDRRQKKRQFRSLWITRINAACREHDMSYSQFMGKLKVAKIELDRKVLADLAMNNPDAFAAIIKQANEGAPKTSETAEKKETTKAVNAPAKVEAAKAAKPVAETEEKPKKSATKAVEKPKPAAKAKKAEPKAEPAKAKKAVAKPKATTKAKPKAKKAE